MHKIYLNIKIKISLFVLFFLFIVHSSILIDIVNAQSINLSITPPLYELILMPGKSVKQTFKLQNLGSDTNITPSIVYFSPKDSFGNVDLTNEPSPDWVKYDPSTFILKSNDIKEFEVTFFPPVDTLESDHFLSLVFESSEGLDILNQTSIGYKTKIAANILLTISKDNKIHKSVQIIEFSSPLVIDSVFGKLKYQLYLKNDGSSFWKANGKISNKYGLLKIAPLNVLGNTHREIFCLDNESLDQCVSDIFFPIGKITSKLEFTLDEDGKTYSQETTTYAFPFFVLFALLILLTLRKFRLIVRLWRKRKS